jgi:hypothetical protein
MLHGELSEILKRRQQTLLVHYVRMQRGLLRERRHRAAQTPRHSAAADG